MLASRSMKGERHSRDYQSNRGKILDAFAIILLRFLFERQTHFSTRFHGENV